MEHFIFVNQIGYEKNGTKLAFVNADKISEKRFSLVDSSGKSVYESDLQVPVYDELSKQNICCCDFSSFCEEGKYCVKCGDNTSFSFSISSGVYRPLYKSILEYYTLSRCGHNLKKNDWVDEECHCSEADIYGTNEKKQVIGGWHDAGDYGRYVVAGSKTIMDLLFAWEASPDYADFDILDEVRFELEWMLRMQREDGAVYHKISCYNFCPFIRPGAEKEIQVIAPVSTTATADFAGCLAYASGIFEKTDSTFASTLLEAAIRAQKYIDLHQDELYTNPSEITTGSYGDRQCEDEKYFALCSLFARTGEEEYLRKAREVQSGEWKESFSWGMVNGYGTRILLQNKDKIKDKDYVKKLEDKLLVQADSVLAVVKKASFKTAITKVFWGSNGGTCDEAHILVLAYKITGKKEFLDGARCQLDYILGCNPMDVCYVTGFGSNPVKNPHHRPSGAAGKAMPGMLSGGPSAGLQDSVAREKLQGKAPLQCFVDHTESYSTNEVAIYWNSSLVLLVSSLGLD